MFQNPKPKTQNPKPKTLRAFRPMSSLHTHSYLLLHVNHYSPFLTLNHSLHVKCQPKIPSLSNRQRIQAKNFETPIDVEDYDINNQAEEEEFKNRIFVGEDGVEEESMGHKRFKERGGEEEGKDKDYDRDPEFADIIGSCLDDPDKAKSKMEERLRRKRNKILHTKTGSPTPMMVKFNKFEFSNSYIWLEFYNDLLEKDVSLLCDTIRSWHIIGRLGGCNAMNMQLSQSPLDQRPTYDAIQGANITPTTFYNIGDLEIQDNVARIWVDIGTSEPLILDTLINALTQISTDYFGIKQVVFGGSVFEHWREDLTLEDAGYSIHKI